MRWGILGTGRILAKYVAAFRLTRQEQLIAVASRDRRRAEAAAARFGIAQAHAPYEELLQNPAVDIVVNALPNGLHCDWTIRALAAGKHVLCEKPLGCSPVEVDAMFAAAHQHRRWLLEGFMYRFHPQLPQALALVRGGDIGRLRYIHAARISYGREPGNPRYDPDAGGGALLDIGCYAVNFARLFAGREPHSVTATAHWAAGDGVDLTLAGTLEFGDGLIAHIICSMEGEPTYAAEVVGDSGKLVIPHPWMPPSWPAEFHIIRQGQVETARVESADVPANVLAPFVAEIEHLADCVRNNRPPTYPPDHDAETDARANIRVIAALQAAARSGQPVRVQPG